MYDFLGWYNVLNDKNFNLFLVFSNSLSLLVSEPKEGVFENNNLFFHFLFFSLPSGMKELILLKCYQPDKLNTLQTDQSIRIIFTLLIC